VAVRVCVLAIPTAFPVAELDISYPVGFCGDLYSQSLVSQEYRPSLTPEYERGNVLSGPSSLACVWCAWAAAPHKKLGG